MGVFQVEIKRHQDIFIHIRVYIFGLHIYLKYIAIIFACRSHTNKREKNEENTTELKYILFMHRNNTYNSISMDENYIDSIPYNS